ncbi:MAG TPA: hypothetical protein PKM50_09650 [Methanoregula sp.]|nr:hypothetical protein [Methanoregula sp.]
MTVKPTRSEEDRIAKGTYGITKQDRETVHYFRNRRRLCPGKGHAHGWLFMPRPAWDPASPGTCPVCLDILRLEKIEEAAKVRKKQHAKV